MAVRGQASFAFQVQPLHLGAGESHLTPRGLSVLRLPSGDVLFWTISCKRRWAACTREGNAMKIAATEMDGFQEILKRKEAELVRVLRTRDDIAIEKSADQMDEIQYASERDLAIRNLDRESSLLRQVRAALRRIHDGSFGTCIECEWVINPRRLAAVPWASRCVQCQEAADRDWQERTESFGETLVNAA